MDWRKTSERGQGQYHLAVAGGLIIGVENHCDPSATADGTDLLQLRRTDWKAASKSFKQLRLSTSRKCSEAILTIDRTNFDPAFVYACLKTRLRERGWTIHHAAVSDIES